MKELNIAILFFIIVQIIVITVTIFRTRNICKAVIAEAYRRMNLHLFMGVIWGAICLFWIFFYISNLPDIQHLFDDGYIKNVFQLFDLNYLEDLQNYFTEKQMLSELVDIVYYRSITFKAVTWTIISGGSAFIYLYRGLQRQKICSNVLATYGGNFRWDDALEYSWEEEVKNRKQTCCSLRIKVKSGNFESKLSNEDYQQVKLRFDITYKDKLDKFLRENITKVG